MNENLFSILIVTQLFDKKINNRKEMTIIKKGTNVSWFLMICIKIWITIIYK